VTTPRYARLAGRVLARTEIPAAAPLPPADRAAAVAAVAVAIRARARRQRWRAWGLSLIGVAAAFALAFGLSRYVAQRSRASAFSGPTAARGVVQIVARLVNANATLESPLAASAEGWTIGAGSRVFAPLDGRVMLSMSSGTNVLVHEGGDVSIVGTGSVQVFRVDAGTVEFRVAKLTPGDRFLVDTSDAEVEVRGTRFRVSIAPDPCANGVVTRVSVTEGVVAVRRAGGEVRVRPGEQWPADCDQPAIPLVPASALPRAALAVPATSGRGESALGEQNALFAVAVDARRRGDTSGAIAALEQLISRYPSGPLDESAHAERLRVLRAAGSNRAEGIARDYLARYPNGFARAEAEAVIAGGR
jgi:FecR-like protein